MCSQATSAVAATSPAASHAPARPVSTCPNIAVQLSSPRLRISRSTTPSNGCSALAATQGNPRRWQNRASASVRSPARRS